METDNHNLDPLKLSVDLAIALERQRSLEDQIHQLEKQSEEKIHQLEKQLKQANTNLKQKEREIDQKKDAYAALHAEHEALKVDLQHVREELAKNSQAATRRSRKKMFLAFIASILFLFASVVGNIGVNNITSVPPNPSSGWPILIATSVIYIVGALITIIYVPEG